MEWIDGNIGSQVNMKYPAVILSGDGSRGTCISIAVSDHGQYQDAGARMIHLGKNTSSTIISKSIVRNGGVANYRGTVRHEKGALNSRSHVECDTLILDDISKAIRFPPIKFSMISRISNTKRRSVRSMKINSFYLMSRGMSEKDATQMIIMGFIEPFSRELPMEYAVELNQLIKMDMEGSVG
jgi:Fe-S cluster assembly protein SufB